MGQVVRHGDRAAFALLRTQAAADAADFADHLHVLALIFVAAADDRLLPVGNKLDQLLRAFLHADPAADADFLVHDRYAILNADGAMRTGRRAASESQTAVIAVPRIKRRQGHGTAVADADIIVLCGSMFTGTVTADACNSPRCGFRVCSHDFIDFIRDRGTAHGAGRCRRISHHDRRCHCVTARIAAGTAVIARQHFPHGRLPRIHVHVEFGSDEHETDTDHNTNRREHNCCN